ncbi:MAG: polysaccharide deacetylase family protein [Muribaculaceae bacterium]|nr:polysaccharide deacetylase family protein [Muribaculaceae bacterium]
MFIEQPPKIFRLLNPEGIYRIPPGEEWREEREERADIGKKVYLTFDDGPIPEATPHVLDILDRYGIKATFFMVGDNVRKYPLLYEEVRRRGHRVGNHTMHHLQGVKCATDSYLKDIDEASRFIDSDLFRPPHGWLRREQARRLIRDFKIIMFDLVTRDYSRRVDAAGVVKNVKRYSRPGSIIVFHDSIKSIGKLETALPESIEWLQKEGYTFHLL